MSEFEYASVIISIVLALGIAEVLRFLADTLRDPGERKVYWVHLLWTIILLELQVEFWWRMWEFQSHLAVGPKLALLLVGPAMLFMATRIMLPRPGDVSDMAQLYYRHKNPFFATMVAVSVWSLGKREWSVPAEQAWLFYGELLLTAAVMGAFIACILSANRRLHGAVVLAVTVSELVEMTSWAVNAQSN